MKNKLLLFDIDGTLIDSQKHIIPNSTKKALRQLREKGYLLGISTGRSLFSVCNGGFDTLVDWDVFICNNGQAIYDKNKKPLHMAYIPEKSVNACLEVAKSFHSPMLIIYDDHEIITEKPNEYAIMSHAFFKETIPPIEPYNGLGVVMMMAYGPMDYDYKDYANIDNISVIPGLSAYADIVLKGYHKFAGIEQVLKHFQVMDYIAFGDSLNDVEMLAHAHIGIAMKHAPKELKEVANIVTDNVLEDGIYNALVSIGLL